MPNTINSDNSNISNPNSIFGKTDSEIREYLLRHNIALIDGPECSIQSNIYPTYSNQQVDTGGYIPGQPDCIDNPIIDGQRSNLHIIRDMLNLSQNQYGPEFIQSYDVDYDIIGSEVTGFKQYSRDTGYDLRGTIVGRTLGFSSISGVDYDSKLEDIAKQKRREELQNRLRLNFTDETVGRVDLDPFNLLSGGDLLNRNYQITTPKTKIGKATQFLSNIAGFTTPVSIIDNGKVNLDDPNNISNLQQTLIEYTGPGQKQQLVNQINRNKYRPYLGIGPGNGLLNTINNSNPFDRNPDSNLEPETNLYIGDNNLQVVNPGLNDIVSGTSFFDPIYKLDTEWDGNGESSLIDQDYPPSIHRNDETTIVGVSTPFSVGESDTNPVLGRDLFDWKKRSNPFKKGILKVTQDLVNDAIKSKGEGNHHHPARMIGIFDDPTNVDLTTKKHINVSKGSNVRGEDGLFCRSWSYTRPYSRMNDLIRHQGLSNIDKNSPSFNYIKYSVLKQNGMVNISDDLNMNDMLRKNIGGGKEFDTYIPRYMFSLENLAWKDSSESQHLKKCERGPNGGRIMWFPPYNLKHTENVSTKWDSTEFIGRGESVYTYNNTERSGTLSWTIIMDHPSSLKQLRDREQEVLERYFAGCDWSTLIKQKEVETREVVDVEQIKSDVDKFNVVPEFSPEPPPVKQLSFFFQNAQSSKNTTGRVFDPSYEYDSLDNECVAPCGCASYSLNTSNVYYSEGGLNSDPYLIFEEQIARFLADPRSGKFYTIKVYGNTSASNTTSYNEKLGNDRATSIAERLKSKIIQYEQEFKDVKDDFIYNKSDSTNFTNRWVIETKSESSATQSAGDENNVLDAGECTPSRNSKNINNLYRKLERRVDIVFELNPEAVAEVREKLVKDTKVKTEKEISDKVDSEIKRISENIVNNYINECDYFKEMEVNAPFIYNSLKEKIQNFHPAFHSITPEGFNSRITFLHQCTRQGPSISSTDKEGKPIGPTNLAFGKPPVCVLRIGDFYHTKIIIDSISFDYSTQQWDLNPEGVGVQPMLVDVNMNFKFIGGSSISGPIRELQNAVSFNFFANTGLYDSGRDPNTNKHFFKEKLNVDEQGNIVKEEKPKVNEVKSDKVVIVDSEPKVDRVNTTVVEIPVINSTVPYTVKVKPVETTIPPITTETGKLFGSTRKKFIVPTPLKKS